MCLNISVETRLSTYRKVFCVFALNGGRVFLGFWTQFQSPLASKTLRTWQHSLALNICTLVEPVIILKTWHLDTFNLFIFVAGQVKSGWSTLFYFPQTTYACSFHQWKIFITWHQCSVHKKQTFRDLKINYSKHKNIFLKYRIYLTLRCFYCSVLFSSIWFSTEAIQWEKCMFKYLEWPVCCANDHLDCSCLEVIPCAWCILFVPMSSEEVQWTLVAGSRSQEAHDGSFLAHLVRLQGVEDDDDPTRGSGRKRVE